MSNHISKKTSGGRRVRPTGSLARRPVSLVLSFLLAFSLFGFLPSNSSFADDTIAVDDSVVGGGGVATDVTTGDTADDNPDTSPAVEPSNDALSDGAQAWTEIVPLADEPVVPRDVVAGSTDYLAGTVNVLGEGHVFDVVTYERLQKSVFNAAQKALIVIGSPRNDTTQAVLSTINTLAAGRGIEKVYFFDPHLAGEFGYDGVDITNPEANSAIFGLWTALKTYSATYGAQFKYLDADFTAADTALLLYDKSAGDATASLPAQLIVKPGDVQDLLDDICPFEGEVAEVFDALGTDEQAQAGQYDFFVSAFSAANPKVNAFYGDDYYQQNPSAFKLRAVSSGELLYLLSTPGTRDILVSGSWCPDSRLAIGWVSENATRYNSGPVYVWDFRANGSTSAVTYLSSDTADALPTAGWVGAEIVKALGTDYVPGFDNSVRSVRPLGDPVAAITPYGKTFRSPYLVKLAVAAGGENRISKEWIHSLQNYELPWHYSVLSSAVAGDKVDYELSSGYLTNAQKALGRATIGDFFAGSPITYAPSNNVSTTVSGSDNGCGDDNDPLDDLGGDKLIPNHGTESYDVSHYDITVSYTPTASAATSIAAQTTVSAQATTDLPIISLDFRALAVNNDGVSLTVGGSPAPIANIARINVDAEDLNKIDITPVTPIAAGQNFTLTIPYTTGILDSFVADGGSPQGFFQRVDGKGIAILGEPLGATYWFPNNDTPADGATYTITLKAPTAYTNVSNGVRSSNSTSGGIRTTVWNVTQDTAPYQVFAYISQDVTEFGGTSSANYPLKSQAVQQVTVSDGEGGTKVIPGLSFANASIYSANNNRNRDKIDQFYNKLPYYIQQLEAIAGPYPGESAGFVFDNIGDGHGEAATWGAIETRDRPFFSTSGVTSEGTFVHEYAHQWYGNAVRIAGWEDLWLNEGFATYVTDLFYENTRDFDVQAKWQGVYTQTGSSNAWWSYAPAAIEKESDLFGGAAASYRRGALALASLRSAVGDEDFFAILSGWVSSQSGKAVTTEDFIEYSEEIAGVELDGWADSWLYGTTKPASWPELIEPGDGGDDDDGTVEEGAIEGHLTADSTEIDWFDGVYKGIEPGHVFVSTTYEYANAILALGDGKNYAFVLGGPENESSQQALATLDKVAKRYGVETIYHLDPRLDGNADGVLDLTNSNGKLDPDFATHWLGSTGAGSTQGGSNNSNASGFGYKLGVGLDPLYTSDDTWFFIWNNATPGQGQTGQVVASYLYDGKEFVGTGKLDREFSAVLETVTDAQTGVTDVAAYPFFDYFSTRINGVVGSAYPTVQIPTDDATRASFTIQTVTLPELFYLLDSPGDYSVFLGGTWCPYTSPTDNITNTYALQNGVSKVYQFDLRLDNSQSKTSLKTNSEWHYGALLEKFSNLQLEESAALYPYYPNNDTSQEQRQALSIGVPFLLEYNRDNAAADGSPAPVRSEWIGYRPFSEDLYAYAWYQKGDVRSYLADPAYQITKLGHPVNPEVDRVDDVNTFGQNSSTMYANSATVALPGLNTFFAGVTANRTASDPWDYTPTSRPTELYRPTSDGGCGSGGEVFTERETPILGQNGNSGYDVQHYDITAAYAEPYQTTTGSEAYPASLLAKTTISALATESLSTISFDFRELGIFSLTVNGVAAGYEQTANAELDSHKLVVTVPEGVTVNEGDSFTVEASYWTTVGGYLFNSDSGQGFVQAKNSNGATAIGEPNGATFWFPSNNNTTDRATYDIELVTPISLVGVSNGVLESKEVIGTNEVRHWAVDQPTIPYLIFASFGEYEEFESTVTLSDGSTIPAYSYVDKTLYSSSTTNKNKAYYFAAELQDYVQWAEGRLGAYPGETVGFVFEQLEGSDGVAVTSSLETVGRPVFSGIPSTSTFVHELIHQWYGDSLTISSWEDLWLNEGFASFLSIIYFEDKGLITGSNKDTNSLYLQFFEDESDSDFWEVAPADPLNVKNLFGNATYGRGAYALAALRVSLGDEVFFDVLQIWSERYAGQSVSTEEFVAVAEEVSNLSLGEFFEVWVYGAGRPDAFPTERIEPSDDGGDEPTYEILEGFGAWTGTGSISARIDAPIDEFVKLSFNSIELVEGVAYELSEGSTIITLLEDFLKTLTPGTYTLAVEFEGGTILYLEFTIPDPDVAYLSISGPDVVAVSATAEYTVSLGNITAPGSFDLTVAISGGLEFEGVEALASGWIASNPKTNDDGSEVITFGPVELDGDAAITEAIPVLKLIFTATEAGSATVSLTDAHASVFTGLDDNGYPETSFVSIALPSGSDATVGTEVTEYDPYDFNRDSFVDLNDLTFAKYYYRASEQTGGVLWDQVVERGIDVTNDGVIDVADYIVIIAHIYA
jgi:aminopeptidase N